MDEKNETKYKLVPRIDGEYDFLVRIKSSMPGISGEYVWETPDGMPRIVRDKEAARILIANLERPEIELSNDPSPDTNIKEDIRREIENATGRIRKASNQIILINTCKNSKLLFEQIVAVAEKKVLVKDTLALKVMIKLIDDALAKMKSNDQIS